MGNFPKSFEVYGFTIEVHAGGRRVWPPSFKRFVKDGLDSGKFALSDVTKECKKGVCSMVNLLVAAATATV